MTEIVRNTLKRVLSAIVLLPIYAFAIVSDNFYTIPMLLIAVIISLVCLWEFFTITAKTTKGPQFVKLGFIAGLGINILFYLYGYGSTYGLINGLDGKIILAAISLLVTVVLIIQVFTRQLEGSSHAIGLLLFGLFFIVFGFGHIILMKSLNDGKYYIIILNMVIMLNDSGAYFGGVLFGRHKVGFQISPNKSWEGYFSGLLFSIAAMLGATWLCAAVFDKHFFSIPEAIILGVVLSFLANIGDLIESVIKRDNAVKDSGTIIPGHGGMWDTMDAVIFSLPVFYYYLVIVKGVH